MEVNKILTGDTLETVKTLPDESIDCVITSPPYYQLRDYGWNGQWGLEKTYQEYLDKLISLMSELKRVLKPTGTMWINLGDTYFGGSGGPSGFDRKAKDLEWYEKSERNLHTRHSKENNIPNKSLMLIPHRFAIRCIDELGLILRNDVIWAKRNGMPESVTDRFSKKHEFFFFFVKQQKYYFDLDGVREKYARLWSSNNGGTLSGKTDYAKGVGYAEREHYPLPNELGKNPGDVSDFWDIPTQSSSEKHYATYNFDLIDKPIIAGCPKDGVILDPFCGTGTTIARAIQLGRTGIGIDGSEEYCKIAEKRIQQELSQLKLSL